MANVTPNVSYSFTMRLRIRNRVGMLARVLRTIAREKGDPGGIDLVRGDGDFRVRDVTVSKVWTMNPAASASRSEPVKQSAEVSGEPSKRRVHGHFAQSTSRAARVYALCRCRSSRVQLLGSRSRTQLQVFAQNACQGSAIGFCTKPCLRRWSAAGTCPTLRRAGRRASRPPRG